MPKNTESTMPIAASSLSREWCKMRWMHATPMMPVTAAPSISKGIDLPEYPSDVATKNAPAIPGRVAWLSASAVSERLRKSANDPITPAAIPSSVVPNITALVLNPLCNVSVSRICFKLTSCSSMRAC